MPATLRSIASSLQLSPATVSNALSGHGRIAASTAKRVRKAALAAGYRYNTLAGSLMAELRRSRSSTFRGLLAAVDLQEPDRPEHGPFHRELIHGARKRAAELGFKLELFEANGGGLTLPRLDTIMKSRGVDGLLLLPSWRTPDFSALDWNRYSGVYTDYNLVEPGLHSVCSDHYGSMMLTLERLQAAGYRRPGLFIEYGRNQRLHRRHASAFQSFFQDYSNDTLPLPPLITGELSRSAFEIWFRRHQPDVVLCHFTCVIDWMQSCGARIPDTHGFVCLNLIKQTHASAGLDLQPALIGERGIEMVIAQLLRNERGLPSSPLRTTVPALWVDGPTVRQKPSDKLNFGNEKVSPLIGSSESRDVEFPRLKTAVSHK